MRVAAGHITAIRGITLIHDLLAVGIAIALGLAVRIGPHAVLSYWAQIILFMAISGIVGYSAGLNGGIWRYASISDLEAVVKAATASILIFALVMFLANRLAEFPRSSLFATWVFSIVFLSGSRVAYRMWRTKRALARGAVEHVNNVILIGATDTAEAFIKAASEGHVHGYHVVGIVDHRERRAGRTIRGVRVLSTIDNLDGVVTKLAEDGLPVTSFVVAVNSGTQGRSFERLADIAEKYGITLLRIPDVARLTDGERITEQIVLQPITLEDLLPRRAINLDNQCIEGLFATSTVFVTGAGGSIGSELCRQLVKLRPERLVLLDSSEFLLHEIEVELKGLRPKTEIIGLIGNVRDRSQIFSHFEAFRPDIVFHSAALKHVPIVERQPLEGLATNVLGTYNVADAAAHVGAKSMVLISTDKAVNPTNVMGASKRMAESYCQALDVSSGTHFVTVRFGNVLGSAGSVVPLFTRQIAAGGPVTVTHPDIERYFMTIPEAVQLVLHATWHGVTNVNSDRGRIFVLDMGRRVKIVEVARKMIRLAGLRPDEDIEIRFTGLRPGEKLIEELFEGSEPGIATAVEGVLSASPRRLFEHDVIAEMFELLAIAVRKGDIRTALSVLTRLVPEYQPQTQAQLPPPAVPLVVVEGAKKAAS